MNVMEAKGLVVTEITGATSAPAPVTSPAGIQPKVKKKMGRPRKYEPEMFVTVALSAQPISSSGPAAVIDFSAEKRPMLRPNIAVINPHQPKFEPVHLGDQWGSSGSVSANFIPHILTVNTGEDVAMKIISFSQQGPRALCILSANGAISSVTLRQPDSSGGTLTYEGRFEILTLTGSFVPSESGGIKHRSGGMSVSLASPDGRVIGGGVAGFLVAASPVQVVVGSFLAGNQQEQKPHKKQKSDYIISPTPASPTPLSSFRVHDTFAGHVHSHHTIGTFSFHEDTRNGCSDNHE